MYLCTTKASKLSREEGEFEARGVALLVREARRGLALARSSAGVSICTFVPVKQVKWAAREEEEEV